MNQFTPLADRFEALHVKVPIAGCWIWIGSVRTNKRGDQRPHLKNNGKIVSAYRTAYEMFVGAIPTGLMVLHRCDISLCVNPHHLFVGTNTDNQRDCVSKGRHVSQTKPEICRGNGRRTGLANTWSRGREGKSIIPHDAVPAILARLAAGEGKRSVAVTYGVSRQALHTFINRAVARAGVPK